MRLAGAAVLLFVTAAPAQQEQDAARRLVLDASRALQAGNAARFLGYFDIDATPGFVRLRRNVLDLLEIKTVASSVDIVKADLAGGVTVLDVDWLLQLTPIRELGSVEHRRQTVRVKVRAGNDPAIVLFEPVEFLSPVSAAEPAPAP